MDRQLLLQDFPERLVVSFLQMFGAEPAGNDLTLLYALVTGLLVNVLGNPKGLIQRVLNI